MLYKYEEQARDILGRFYFQYFILVSISGGRFFLYKTIVLLALNC